MTTHTFDHVEDDGDGFVIVCSCGWRSPRHPSASGAGTAWDEHRTAG